MKIGPSVPFFLFSMDMWDLPRSGIELISPALAGRFFIIRPPGKSYTIFIDSTYMCKVIQKNKNKCHTLSHICGISWLISSLSHVIL